MRESPLGGDIAFAHTQPSKGSSGLYLADDSGSVEQLLGEDGTFYLAVDWANDQLVYVAGPAGGSQFSLRVVDAEGTNERVIAAPSGGRPGYPVSSPDGSEVAFARHQPDGSASVFTVGVDGTGEREVDLGGFEVPPDFPCDGLTPSAATPVDWSPSGEDLLVRVSRHGCEVEFSNLAVVSADGVVRGLNAARSVRADWSPSGLFIAYETDHGLFVQPAPGEPDEELAERIDVGPGQAPDWSATGDLAFIRARVWEDISTYGVWSAPIEDLGDARPVVEPGLRASDPLWSPGRSHIAYLGLTGTGSDLWVTTSDGAEPVQVQSPEGYVLDFAYGPGDSAADGVQVERLGGASRFETAVRISRETFAPGTSDAWLARGDAFPDALVAAYPAGFHDGGGPLLLTPSDRLHDAVTGELQRLETERVFIMGSEAAISSDVQVELDDLGYETIRVAGSDRYETAASAAGLAPDTLGVAFVATGTDFADALVAGPLTFSLGWPILLTPPNSLHPAAAKALYDRGVPEVVIVGGAAAVSKRVAEQIARICFEPELCIRVRRIGGATRTETAALLADEFVARLGGPPTHVNVARGDAYPDAAAGGPHGGRENAPILLSASPGTLGSAARAWLESHSATIDSIHAFGSQNALTNQVLEGARKAATSP